MEFWNLSQRKINNFVATAEGNLILNWQKLTFQNMSATINCTLQLSTFLLFLFTVHCFTNIHCPNIHTKASLGWGRGCSVLASHSCCSLYYLNDFASCDHHQDPRPSHLFLMIDVCSCWRILMTCLLGVDDDHLTSASSENWSRCLAGLEDEDPYHFRYLVNFLSVGSHSLLSTLIFVYFALRSWCFHSQSCRSWAPRTLLRYV